MILAARSEGSGVPLVILHGLFGSGDNWRTVAGQLGKQFTVVTLDLRNHGSSPHDPGMQYPDMAADVAETLDARGIDAAHLLGHSMGGKVAMYFALQQPRRTLSLVVVDIVPRRYPPRHAQILAAMPELERAAARSRKQADAVLTRFIDNRMVRAFLLKSVALDDNGVYRWTLNVSAITRQYRVISDWPGPPGQYHGPTLLIRGAASDYITDGDLQTTRRWFPAVRLEEITDAGHWVHAEQRGRFCDMVKRFLASHHWHN
ncbi:MAG: alpha/beta fold hydrolase [Spirochaetaceae bacterium]|nr:MAG: alpha/beta fold hydrolase [Spirochaetaceae bacterium]